MNVALTRGRRTLKLAPAPAIDIWRVLRPDGVVKLHVPQAPGITTFQDPTHVTVARFKARKVRRLRNLWTRFFVTFDFAYLNNLLLDLELVAQKG